MSLRAPAAVEVEVRQGFDKDAPRVFRLSRFIGEDGVRLATPAPFEPGRSVQVTFTPPGATAPLSLRAELRPADEDGDEDGDGDDGGSELTFLDPPREARAALAAYVTERLGLPR